MELREQRASRVMEMRGLVETAERETRDLSGGEQTRFDELRAQVTGLEAQIGRAETLAEFERRADNAEPISRHGGERELEQRFSIGRALSDMLEHGRLQGVEAEYAAEHRSGRQNAFAAPVSLFLRSEQRALLTTNPSAGPGSNLIATQLGPMIDLARPNLAVQGLGARVLAGLTSNLDLPRMKASGSAGWVGEHQEGPQGDPLFDKVSMSPKTVTGTYEVSRRMMLQASQIEQILRDDLGFLLAQQLDFAATLSLGSGNAPRGIRGTPGVKKFTPTFANAPAMTVSELDQAFSGMISAVEVANLASARTGFLTNPKVRTTLGTYRDGNGQPVGLSTMQGEPVTYSTQIPANGGTGTNQSYVFYGAWDNLLIGYWSSVDILLNPYADSIFKKGGAYITAFLDADVAVRHPEAFCFMDNFYTSTVPFTTVS